MFRILNTDTKLRCAHGAGLVQLGQGAESYLVQGKPAVRVADVLNQPVSGCPYCKQVTAVQLGQEDCLVIEDSPVLTELAFGTTNAGIWAVDPAPGWSVLIGLSVDLSEGIPESKLEAAPPIQQRAEEKSSEWSGPLALREWRSYLCPKPDPKSFEPNPKPVDACGREGACDRPLVSKWLYVFDAEDRGRLRFRSEYRVSSSGLVQAVARSELRRDAKPPEMKLGSPELLRLPLKAGGASKYAFLASQVRLTEKALKQYGRSAELDVVVLAADSATVCATDPLAVALEKAHRYISARDLLIEYTLPVEQTAGKQTGPDPQKVLLARLLQDIIDGDPNDKLGLDSEIMGGRETVRRFLDEYLSEIERLAYSSERAAEQLVRWLNSPIWTVTAGAYVAFPTEDFPEFLKVYSVCVERLTETITGRAYLKAVLKDQPRFIRTYILPDRMISAGDFEVVRKAPEAIIKVWEALVTPALRRGRDRWLRQYIISLGFAFRLEWHLWEQVSDRVFRVWRESHAIEIRLEWGLSPAKLGKALEGADALLNNERVINRLQAALEVVNVGLALHKVLTGEERDKARNWFGVVGAIADALKEVGPATAHLTGRVGEVFLRKGVKAGLGAVSALLDIVGGVWDVGRALVIDNPKGAVGPGISAVGGSLILVSVLQGTRWARFLGALRGVRGGNVWGALLMVGGAAVTVWLEKTDMQWFARYSEWGVAPGSDDTWPKWATARYRDWKSRPDVQLEALCCLLGAFRLQSTVPNRVRVEFGGLLLPTTRIEVWFDRQFPSGAKHRPGFLIEWGSRKVELLPGSDPADVAGVTFSNAGTERWLEVLADWPKGQKPGPWEPQLGGECRVHVDIFGNKGIFLPGRDVWLKLPLPIPRPDAFLEASESTSSLDVECSPR